MRKFLKRIHRGRYFLLFIALFAYAQSIDSRVRERETLDFYSFTPDAAIGTLIAVSILFLVLTFFISRWQKTDIFRTNEIVKIFASSLVSYILIMLAIEFATAFFFGNLERNFNRKIFTLITFYYLLNGFIYGSFFLAYNYYNKNIRNQEQLATYNRAISESRINQLKTQLNPHFLFNNLNRLDQLIEEDKQIASDFLNEFADIYRFVLQTSDKKVIPVSEEMAFAEGYFRLIKHKYGDAYQLKIEGLNNNGFIVHLSLQLLIENVVKHNLGSEKNPVFIKILADKNISISNNMIPKQHLQSVSGRALENLIKQYKLLAYKPVEIQTSNNLFSVIIPFINNQDK